MASGNADSQGVFQAGSPIFPVVFPIKPNVSFVEKPLGFPVTSLFVQEAYSSLTKGDHPWYSWWWWFQAVQITWDVIQHKKHQQWDRIQYSSWITGLGLSYLLKLFTSNETKHLLPSFVPGIFVGKKTQAWKTKATENASFRSTGGEDPRQVRRCVLVCFYGRPLAGHSGGLRAVPPEKCRPSRPPECLNLWKMQNAQLELPIVILRWIHPW